MKTLRLLMVSLLVISFMGCGDDDKDKKDDVVTFEMDKVTYQVPEGVILVDAKIEGAKAQMMSSGENEELSAFIIQNSAVAPKIANAPAYKTIQKGIESIYTQLRSLSDIDNVSLLSSQNFQTPYAFSIASYALTTNAELEPLTLAGKILNVIAGGKAKGLPLAAANAPVDTKFRLILLYGVYEGNTFYIAVVVPERLYNTYRTKGNDILNASRVYPEGKTLTSTSKKFTQAQGQQNADFLFVVDDSGSMSDNQAALSQAADDFSAEMASAGLTYSAAIITTGYGATDVTHGAAYHILRSKGIIENNDTALKQALVAGTYGSGTETGIWNAEQSLQSLALHDSYDGAVTLAGMPHANTNLSVIIISDERSQYRSRSNGLDFNVSSNLFISRNITVHAIIDNPLDQYNRSQYDDLALNTHGRISDIDNKVAGVLSFRDIMSKIATDAGGAASAFVLDYPVVSITEVKVNGTIVPKDPINGYTYLQGTQSIVFHGTSIPAAGASIEVSYTYYQ